MVNTSVGILGNLVNALALETADRSMISIPLVLELANANYDMQIHHSSLATLAEMFFVLAIMFLKSPHCFVNVSAENLRK